MRCRLPAAPAFPTHGEGGAKRRMRSPRSGSRILLLSPSPRVLGVSPGVSRKPGDGGSLKTRSADCRTRCVCHRFAMTQSTRRERLPRPVVPRRRSVPRRRGDSRIARRPQVCHCEPGRSLVWQSIFFYRPPPLVLLSRGRPSVARRSASASVPPVGATFGRPPIHVSVRPRRRGDLRSPADPRQRPSTP